MIEKDLISEMRAMWDAVLAGGFGVDSIEDLPSERVPEAFQMWRDEIAEHPEAEAMDALIEKVAEQWDS